jgi:hypothetical protein
MATSIEYKGSGHTEVKSKTEGSGSDIIQLGSNSQVNKFPNSTGKVPSESGIPNPEDTPTEQMATSIEYEGSGHADVKSETEGSGSDIIQLGSNRRVHGFLVSIGKVSSESGIPNIENTPIEQMATSIEYEGSGHADVKSETEGSGTAPTDSVM